MSYISFTFIFFVAISFALYYITPIKIRPYILLTSNMVFYLYSGLENTIYLFAIISISYIVGRLLDKCSRYRKLILFIYLTAVIGSLLFIKFINYVLNITTTLLKVNSILFSVIVPLGISFFTLQAIGYVVDIYRKKYKSEKNLLFFASFMSYFPIIVQGPISRYDQLAQQLKIGHKFDYNEFTYGIQLTFWGLFKKLVIANRAAMFADRIFNNYEEFSGIAVIFGVLFYSLQIYTDFSGCVDICRGVSQMFGIKIINNFDHPYFSVSIKDFWRRWHISLSSWLRDYVYISLGGNRKGTLRKYINLLATFFVSGLWHGVGIHYMIWGLYHGLCQIISELIKKPKDNLYNKLKIKTNVFSFKFGQQITTFSLIAYSWLLFRANGTIAALKMTLNMFKDFYNVNQLNTLFGDGKDMNVLLVSTVVLLAASLLQRNISIREAIAKQNLLFRWVLYILLFFSVVIFGVYGSGFDASDFLYMQF